MVPVSTPVGIVPEFILPGKNGFVTSSTEPEWALRDLTWFLTRLHEDRQLLRKMKLAAWQTVYDDWRWSVVVSQWDSFFETAHAAIVRVPTIAYDFVEIGTADFETLIELADDSKVGLSVEPLRFYLDRLPDRKKVTKVNLAVSDCDGVMSITHIDAADIPKHGLPDWLRGCNFSGPHHKSLESAIGARSLWHLLKVSNL
jgi:hypothetical protein